METVTKSASHSAVIWLLAIALAVLAFQLQGDIGLNMADEGYLWYGTWRVGAGEVPRVDFRAYDAPRNYWLAFWSPLFGGGLLGLRAGAAVFQVIGLGLGLLVARRVVSRGWLVPIGCLFLVWMFPRHKVFEHSIAIAAVYVVLLMIENPGRRGAFLGGFFVGLAGAFRRNHGLYTLFATSTAIIVSIERPLSPKKLMGAFLPFATGIVVGFFPVWMLVAFRPGFGAAYLESVLVIFRRGQTNQPLPVPWPWSVDLSGLEPWTAMHVLASGVAFVLLFGFFPVALYLLWTRRGEESTARRVLLAATLVGLPYLHHASVRSDVSHLCQVVHPVLLGAVAMIALAAGHRRRLLLASGAAVALVALTLAVPAFVQPLGQRARSPRAFTRIELAGNELWIRERQARIVEASRELLASAAPEDLVFIASMSPALYPILGRRAPVWDSYPIWPPTPAEGRKMIGDLSRPEVRWAIIDGQAVNDERFWDTHPEVWEYLRSSFDVVETHGFPASYTVLRRRTGPPSGE